jgi:DNA-binding transcriptional LysR family regulator
VRFGEDRELLDLLLGGDLDIAVTSTSTTKRGITATAVGSKKFVLVGAPGLAPERPLPTLAALADWLEAKPWVSYSLELPLTRRFWQTALGRPFAGDLRLVAPDLRATLGAVEQGLGVSLLPSFVCTDALAEGRIVELYPIAELVPAEPWFLCTRVAEAAEPELLRLVSLLSGA